MKKIIKPLLIVLLLYIISVFLSIKFINDKNLLTNYFGNLPIDISRKYANLMHVYIWVDVLVLFVFVIAKLYTIATTIWIGCFFFNYKVSFNDILLIIIYSEFVFIIYTFFRLTCIYFYNFKSLSELQNFQPLSLFSLLYKSSINLQYFNYPLQVFNLFELLYILSLSFFIGRKLNLNFKKGFFLILKTYGVVLVFWISFIVFMNLLFTA